MTDIPIVVTAAGAQPTPPSVLRADLVAGVAATNPGYTADLPGALIEDVASTQVAGLSYCDTARVETINSLTPYGANAFLLLELGQIYIGDGSAPAVPTNTSVFVVFTALDNSANPLPGLVISPGFVVSDGTYQYIVQGGGGVTDSSGSTQPLFCQASIPGTWSVSTNTVDQVVTSVPSTVVLSCTNPTTGTSGGPAETEEQYRARVLEAGQAISTGTQTLLKTLLGEVPNVQRRLISVRQKVNAWEVICGGGDPYLIAGAIYQAGVDITNLVGSTLSVTNVTRANPGVVTTDLNHGLATGQTGVKIAGMVGMTPLNGVPFTATVINEKSFSVGINTTGYAAYVSGGTVTPNLRNELISIYDPPDTYTIPFVNPPQQAVSMSLIYQTISPNFTSQAAVSQLGQPAIADYVNSLSVGEPINLNVLETTFSAAISGVLAPQLISSLVIAVFINGVQTAPVGLLVYGDPESYFLAQASDINIIAS